MRYAADRYVGLLKFKANVVMINTSGIIANYKTSLPYHFQNPYLAGDLKEIVNACHDAGIKVIGRMDFKVRKLSMKNLSGLYKPQG